MNIQFTSITKLMGIVLIGCSLSACSTMDNKAIGFQEISAFNVKQSEYVRPHSGKVVLFTKSPRADNDKDYQRTDFTY